MIAKQLLSLLLASILPVILSACSSMSELSHFSPYNKYSGRTLKLVSPMPVEYSFKANRPSKVVSAGTMVKINRVFMEKKYIEGPIIPGVAIDTQIFAALEYPDPITSNFVKWNYPLGVKQAPSGYAEYILVAPWEPTSTPRLRFVGKDGKAYKE